MSKLFRHIFLKKEKTTQKIENNLNDICDMAKIRDLKDFYKTVTKSFLSSASGSVIKQKYLSLVIR